jgi:hypothetical protein
MMALFPPKSRSRASATAPVTREFLDVLSRAGPRDVERMGFLRDVSLKLPASEAGCYGGGEAMTMQSPNRSRRLPQSTMIA